MDKKNFYCVIMAGGIGSRFWPASREDNPKQFIDILGDGQSLIQKTYNRFRRFIPKENIFVVTGERYRQLTAEHLPELTPQQILTEPFGRNTAPCIAYANKKIKFINATATIVVSPADHLVSNEEQFQEDIVTGLEFATKNNDALLTLGIKPDHPNTGYGYIQIDKETKTSIENLYKVKTFTEKPNLELAKKFVQLGEFYWNSGMFIWNINAIERAFEAYLPEMNFAFEERLTDINSDHETETILDIYNNIKSISIDYGIMEKANKVFVLCTDFGWSDLGTWASLYAIGDKDSDKNNIRAKKSALYDTKDTILFSQNKKKLYVLKGMDNFIIVDTDDALLILPKQEEQSIKQIVGDLKLKKLINTNHDNRKNKH